MEHTVKPEDVAEFEAYKAFIAMKAMANKGSEGTQAMKPDLVDDPSAEPQVQTQSEAKTEPLSEINKISWPAFFKKVKDIISKDGVEDAKMPYMMQFSSYLKEKKSMDLWEDSEIQQEYFKWNVDDPKEEVKEVKAKEEVKEKSMKRQKDKEDIKEEVKENIVKKQKYKEEVKEEVKEKIVKKQKDKEEVKEKPAKKQNEKEEVKEKPAKKQNEKEEVKEKHAKKQNDKEEVRAKEEVKEMDAEKMLEKKRDVKKGKKQDPKPQPEPTPPVVIQKVIIVKSNEEDLDDKKGKKVIPKHVKTLVWNKYIGSDKAKAPCMSCRQEEIGIRSFHCGHVIAEAKGGDMTINNLRPICAACNASMGTMSMNEFTSQFFGWSI